MTDVVYVLGTGSPWSDNELRYSLRSLETFVEDLGQVYIVGTRPRWLKSAVHLPFPDLFVCKERNIMLKLAHACGHPDLSKIFLHVHDDHFCLAPAVASQIPNWRGGQLDRLAMGIDKKNHWRDAVLNTHRALEAKGLTTFNFDLHYPMLFDKDLYPEIMDRYDWKTERGYVVKSLYANTLGLADVASYDLKINDRIDFRTLVTRLQGRPWFSVGNQGLTGTFKSLLASLYPEPSRFEIV